VNKTEQKKQDWIAAAPTKVLQRIINNYTGNDSPTHDHPMAGIVHIDGVGQIPVRALRTELRGRQDS
jgi:hypothetical protein